jgi:hypothetical protein
MQTCSHHTSAARARDRLAARLLAHRLDVALASGVSPNARESLTVRAQKLIEPRVRATLGGQLRRLLRDAMSGRVSLGTKIRPRQSKVLAAADQLDALADRLLSRDAVDARGVAQVRLLLTDGTGPLYHSGATEDLRAVAAGALRHLHPTQRR